MLLLIKIDKHIFMDIMISIIDYENVELFKFFYDYDLELFKVVPRMRNSKVVMGMDMWIIMIITKHKIRLSKFLITKGFDIASIPLFQYQTSEFRNKVLQNPCQAKTKNGSNCKNKTITTYCKLHSKIN